jgi:hypothetical protein
MRFIDDGIDRLVDIEGGPRSGICADGVDVAKQESLPVPHEVHCHRNRIAAAIGKSGERSGAAASLRRT